MTTFKPGDLVTGTTRGDTVHTGVLLAAGQPFEMMGERTICEDSDELENGTYVLERSLRVPRPLVGPAPTPPAAPRYVAPFTAVDKYVRDANRTIVLEVAFTFNDDGDSEKDFATYVATALNASIFNED